MQKKRYLIGRMTDFLIFLLFFSIIALSVSFLNKILYSEEDFIGKTSITTLPLSKEYENSLRVGDMLYDAVTKRCVGEVTGVKKSYLEESNFYFIIEIDAQRLPRANALRSHRIYLEIKEVTEA